MSDKKEKTHFENRYTKDNKMNAMDKNKRQQTISFNMARAELDIHF